MQTNKLQYHVINHSKYKQYKINCISCGIQFFVAPWRYKRDPKYCSYKCYWKSKKNDIPWIAGTKGYIKPNITSFKPFGRSFNGDIKEYKNIHYKISKLFGKPDTCEKCGSSNLYGQKIHWANISGNYSTNRGDWIRLCSRCHFIYDYKNHIGIEYGSNTL